MEKISVIIPIFNAEKYLKRCVNSIIEQSYQNLQIILIDDGSEDGSASICDDFADKDSRVIVIHTENNGVSSARNRGLDVAAGDYIGFVDSDDYIDPDMYEVLYQFINHENADICCCGYYDEFDGQVETRCCCDSRIRVINGADYCYQELFCHSNCIGNGDWNKLFRSSLLTDIRFKNYVVGEDVEFLCRAIHNSSRLVCVNDVKYHYVHYADTATSSIFSKRNMDIITVADELLEFIANEHPAALPQMYAYHLMWYTATVQVIYRSKSTVAFHKEKEQLRTKMKSHFSHYILNPYAYFLNKVYLLAYLTYSLRLFLIIRDYIHLLRSGIKSQGKR